MHKFYNLTMGLKYIGNRLILLSNKVFDIPEISILGKNPNKQTKQNEGAVTLEG